MPDIKIVKVVFYLTALLLVAKPFFGFSVSGHLSPAIKTNILVKVFTKRLKQSSESDSNSIQKKLAETISKYTLRFSFFLALLFPLAFKPGKTLTSGLLHQMYLSSLFSKGLIQLSCKLII